MGLWTDIFALGDEADSRRLDVVFNAGIVLLV